MEFKKVSLLVLLSLSMTSAFCAAGGDESESQPNDGSLERYRPLFEKYKETVEELRRRVATTPHEILEVSVPDDTYKIDYLIGRTPTLPTIGYTGKHVVEKFTINGSVVDITYHKIVVDALSTRLEVIQKEDIDNEKERFFLEEIINKVSPN